MKTLIKEAWSYNVNEQIVNSKENETKIVVHNTFPRLYQRLDTEYQ